MQEIRSTVRKCARDSCTDKIHLNWRHIILDPLVETDLVSKLEVRFNCALCKVFKTGSNSG